MKNKPGFRMTGIYIIINQNYVIVFYNELLYVIYCKSFEEIGYRLAGIH